LQALKGLKSRLGDIKQYLEAVISGQLPVNNEIIGLVQDMFNLLPNLNIASLAQSLTGVHLSDRRQLYVHEKGGAVDVSMGIRLVLLLLWFHC
jgi:hypothetical protein